MMTITELLTLNLLDIKKKTRATGWNAREVHTRMFCSLWGDLPANSLTRYMVEDWAAERKRTRADATVKFELSLLKRAFNLAIDRELLELSPMARTRVKLRPHKRHQVLSEDQEATLRRAYYTHVKHGEMHWLTEQFALLTGVRLGEQAHLRPDHINGDLMEVPEQGKTGTRLVPLCRGALAIAHFWIDFALEFGSQWLFWPTRRNPDRNAMAENYVSKIFSPTARAAGLKGFQRRDLRRTFASRLIAAGQPIFDVQKLLGHTNTMTTQTYCHVGMDKLRGTVAVLDRAK